MASRTTPKPRSLQQPTMSLPHLSYQRAVLKAFSDYGVLGHKPLTSLHEPLISLALFQTPTF